VLTKRIVHVEIKFIRYNRVSLYKLFELFFNIHTFRPKMRCPANPTLQCNVTLTKHWTTRLTKID